MAFSVRLVRAVLGCLPHPKTAGLYFPFEVDVLALTPAREMFVTMPYVGPTGDAAAAVIAQPRLHVSCSWVLFAS